MKNKKILFIDFYGAIVTKENSDLLMPKVISSLNKLKSEENFFFVLNDLNEKNLKEKENKILTILEREGIVFDALGTELINFEFFNLVHSVYISSGENKLNCKTIFINEIENGWLEILSIIFGKKQIKIDRMVTVERKTKETNIKLKINLDGIIENPSISTGIGFFDHMLEQILRHTGIGMKLISSGDLEVDEHHSVEDVAIVFGKAINQALGEKRGISRYGYWILPMDEVQAIVAIDFSGRSELVWNVDIQREYIGGFPTEMFYHFFKSFSSSANCTLHISCSNGNAHHMVEAIFKSFSKALKESIKICPFDNRLPSTKGVL